MEFDLKRNATGMLCLKATDLDDPDCPQTMLLDDFELDKLVVFLQDEWGEHE